MGGSQQRPGRRHGVVASAGGLLSFGHLGWGYRDRAEFLARAAECITDGLDYDQRVVYVGEGSRAALEAELAVMRGVRDRVDDGALACGALIALPSAEYYRFRPDSGIIDAAATAARSVKATKRAIADGYTGLRAVVNSTVVARTPEQRDAVAQFEFLMDQQLATLPATALCAYDISELGDDAREAICLHPMVNRGAVPFRLYTEAYTGLGLTGEVDATSDELFTTTLQRIWPLVTGETMVVDAQGLKFVNHRQLLTLDRLARGDGRKVVLRTDQRVPNVLAGLLDLTNVFVEPPA